MELQQMSNNLVVTTIGESIGEIVIRPLCYYSIEPGTTIRNNLVVQPWVADVIAWY